MSKRIILTLISPLLLLLLNAVGFAANLAEFSGWPQATTLSITQTSSGQGSLRASAKGGWDQQYLYLQVMVTDHSVAPATDINRDFSGVDHVAIYVNPTGDAPGQGRTKPGSNDYIFLITPSNAFGDPMITTSGFSGHQHLSLDLRMIDYRVSKSNSGYMLDIHIPWKLLKSTPQANTAIGLNLVVRDVQTGQKKGEVALTNASPHDNPSDWPQFRLIKKH